MKTGGIACKKYILMGKNTIGIDASSYLNSWQCQWKFSLIKNIRFWLFPKAHLFLGQGINIPGKILLLAGPVPASILMVFCKKVHSVALENPLTWKQVCLTSKTRDPIHFFFLKETAASSSAIMNLYWMNNLVCMYRAQ